MVLTKQAASLVQVLVIGPAVERRKSLLTHSTATAAVDRAVGTGAVPGHTDEQTAVVAEISGPPVL